METALEVGREAPENNDSDLSKEKDLTTKRKCRQVRTRRNEIGIGELLKEKYRQDIDRHQKFDLKSCK